MAPKANQDDGLRRRAAYLAIHGCVIIIPRQADSSGGGSTLQRGHERRDDAYIIEAGGGEQIIESGRADCCVVAECWSAC